MPSAKARAGAKGINTPRDVVDRPVRVTLCDGASDCPVGRKATEREERVCKVVRRQGELAAESV
jgi:hypothetical protein